MTDTSTLSPAQQRLYQAALDGKNQDTIMRELGLTPATFAAQCTRMKHKGFRLQFLTETPTHASPPSPPAQVVKPAAADTGSDGEQVINEALKNGPATYDVEKIIGEAQRQGNIHGDMRELHPLAVMGVTIQFMRLCGGRFHAHQIIEDVYGAIRLLNGDNPDTAFNSTKPFASTLTQADLSAFVGKVEGVKEELEAMCNKLKVPTA